MSTNELLFRFKGDRNYIHGSDIFDDLEQWLKKQGKYIQELSFRSFSDKHLACVFSEPADEIKAEGKALDSEGKQTLFWLIETSQPVVERYPFDEDAITSHAQITGKTIEASATDTYSVIEQVIALTKALNYSLTPDIDGKWVFGQLRLKETLPEEAQHFVIRQKTLLGGRFSTQEIKLDDRVVGDIRFITSKS